MPSPFDAPNDRPDTTYAAMKYLAYAFGALGLIYGMTNNAALADYNLVRRDISNVELGTVAIAMALMIAGGAALAGAALAFLADTPFSMAIARGHPNAQSIRACGWFGLLVFPAWIVAIIWALANTSKPAPQVVKPPDLPGRFEVVGVDKATGMDTRFTVDADSPANARVKGELRGMVVTAVYAA